MKMFLFFAIILGIAALLATISVSVIMFWILADAIFGKHRKRMEAEYDEMNREVRNRITKSGRRT